MNGIQLPQGGEELDVNSGAVENIKSGGALEINGTDVTPGSFEFRHSDQ